MASTRPAAVLATAGVLIFLGVSATAGGAALVSGAGAPPHDWLRDVPLIDSWLVPGLVLGLGFGVGSLLVAYAMLTQHRWSWPATLLIGLGLALWLGLELVYLPRPSALQAVYGAVALALLVLPLRPAVRRHLSAHSPASR